ncbi:unnamed protein product [Didymodactylos carnosus]|uniref:Uncharacterized protein n=1 Tax=Didymodactylos carnosus TaxID=1234261 RepID=A0A814G4H2_9BILA|nr:unnamed protein product [Didymodactylos carnosus]CAF1308418.1 unnamed protein product [Didymodactylos carnosus]CAF3763505.1 unnamed protein product [Didymodactylos carnosus]CAF4115736.1 unnamed protein product [Didymodactylos carnosus]
MQTFIRNNKLTSSLNDVAVWNKTLMALCDMDMISSFIEQTIKYQETLKKADATLEERDNDIIKDDAQSDSEAEPTD